MNTTQTPYTEARNFFRIIDKLELSYRLADPNETENPNYSFDIVAIDKHHDLLRALEILNKDAHELLNKIAEDNSLLANYLKILDHKVLLLTKSLIYKADMKKNSLQSVNLSEAGIAFGTNELLPIDSQVRIKIVLDPIFHEIAVYGKVVRTELRENATKADPDFPYWIAVYFTHIQNSDRQLLARYILQKQTLRCKEQD